MENMTSTKNRTIVTILSGEQGEMIEVAGLRRTARGPITSRGVIVNGALAAEFDTFEDARAEAHRIAGR
jgi:hypothetical protein